MRNQHEAQVEKEERSAKPAQEKEFAIIAVGLVMVWLKSCKAQGVDYLSLAGKL